MQALDWENLDDFLDTAEFAVSGILSCQSGGSVSVSVIFDDPYLNAQLGEYEMDTTNPRVLGKLSELNLARRGDILTIGPRDYDVLTSAQPDGTGMATLSLATR
jgi:hypothetical protein